MTSQPIYTVSKLNQSARLLLEEGLGTIWVEGEISNFIRASSGHIYFSLKDENAQVRCAYFKGRRNQQNDWKQGMQVLACAKVSLYEPRGDYQLIVEYVEEAGIGALQKAFEVLKAKLQAEGLFATEHKKPLPAYPQCLGVITSPTGAAIMDILHVLERRYPNLPVIVYPTLVQGTSAAAQIAHMIEVANQHQKCDVLIVARGGGSMEDLWPFNEEIVARAIYNSEIPIVSGVGHEVDFTIADFVADVRAPTPSAAAELVSPDGEALLGYLEQLQSRVIQQIGHRITFKHHQLQNLQSRLRHPRERLQFFAQKLDEQTHRLEQAWHKIVTKRQHKLSLLLQTLQTLSPTATLFRGYAIVKNAKGKIIRNASDVNQGEAIFTTVSEGEIKSRVE
ncbi:MAG: exodeoxyribonuclease VII large subunit [Gammaproteobacteria bacterium]|jgi:exodeoxyribonuclease VII large subunit